MLGTYSDKTFKEFFLGNTPNKPLAANCFSAGMFQQEKAKAITMRNMQVNTADIKRWLVLDLDYEASAFAVEDLLSIRPTQVTINPANTHSHVLFALTDAVHSSSSKSKQWLYDIRQRYDFVLSGDTVYAGTVSKNPLCKHWHTLYPVSEPCLTYSLGELTEALPDGLKERMKDAKQAKLDISHSVGTEGRNQALFDSLRTWAAYNVMHYRQTISSTWLAALLEQADLMNNTFSVPLRDSEVRSVSKSVSRRIFPHSPTDDRAASAFIAKQSYRGNLGGIKSGKVRKVQSENKRVSARLMKAKGLSNASIAKELSVSDRTIRNWFAAER